MADGAEPHAAVSIHALLAESDAIGRRGRAARGSFYPRSPCGERQCWYMIQTIRWCFYPRSPCGERPGLPLAQSAAKWFLSTLSLRRATPDAAKLCGIQPFLSTLSLRRATVTVLGIQHRVGVSIHALLAESDCPFLSLCRPFLLFLSTLSLRRATGQNLVNGIRLVVSIHALLAESDKIDKILNLAARRFYPRSPCGERHPEKSESLTTYLVSIHALLAESDIRTP